MPPEPFDHADRARGRDPGDRRAATSATRCGRCSGCGATRSSSPRATTPRGGVRDAPQRHRAVRRCGPSRRARSRCGCRLRVARRTRARREPLHRAVDGHQRRGHGAVDRCRAVPARVVGQPPPRPAVAPARADVMTRRRDEHDLADRRTGVRRTAVTRASPGRPPIQAAGTALSRITGFGRIFALAYALGAARLADTYTLANNTPNIIYELILGGVLSGTLLPVFVRAAPRRRRRGRRLARHLRGAHPRPRRRRGAVARLRRRRAAVHPPLHAAQRRRRRRRPDRGGHRACCGCSRRRCFFYGMISVTTAILRGPPAVRGADVRPGAQQRRRHRPVPRLPHGRRASASLEGVRDDGGAVLLLGLMTTAGVAAMALAQFPFAHRPAPPALRLGAAPPRRADDRSGSRDGPSASVLPTRSPSSSCTCWPTASRATSPSTSSRTRSSCCPTASSSVSIISAVQPELAERWAAGDIEGFRRQLVGRDPHDRRPARPRRRRVRRARPPDRGGAARARRARGRRRRPGRRHAGADGARACRPSAAGCS